MMKIFNLNADYHNQTNSWYLLGSRPLTHLVFWLGYYLLFSLIWMKPEQGYFASFYLEFVLLPVRILAAYGMLYWLIPQLLLAQRYRDFVLAYLVLLLVAGGLQRLSDYFFYQQLLFEQTGSLFDGAAWLRSVILINTTVILLAAVKIFQLYLKKQREVEQLQLQLAEQQNSVDSILELKANRRTHQVKASQILYIEGMGNYVSYYLRDGEKIVVYSSIKATLAQLPRQFIRLHRSYIINLDYIESYSHENVILAGHTLPRGSDISDQMLKR